MVDFLTEHDLADKYFVLVVEEDEANPIDPIYSLLFADEPDADYVDQLDNEAGVKLATSNFNLRFLGTNIVLDYHNHQIKLSNNTGVLSDNVRLRSLTDELDEQDNVAKD